MATFSTLYVAIYELKGKTQAFHEQFMYVATFVKDLTMANKFTCEKEREKKHLEAQLHDLE